MVCKKNSTHCNRIKFTLILNNIVLKALKQIVFFVLFPRKKEQKDINLMLVSRYTDENEYRNFQCFGKQNTNTLSDILCF